jgi:hypothetical protein
LPAYAGTVNETVACPFPALADTDVGTPGTLPDCEALDPSIGIYYTAVFRYLNITTPEPPLPAPVVGSLIPTDTPPEPPPVFAGELAEDVL